MPIQVANAPVSWAIYEFEDIEPQFTYTQVLDEIAATGYAGMELGPYGFLPTDPDAARVELQKRNLTMIAAFVPVKLVDEAAHADAEAEALRVGKLLAALDARYIVLADDNGSVDQLVKKAGQRTGSMLAGEQWDAVAAGVSRIARKIKDDTGLKTVFHHHCAGYVETPDETRELLKRIDSDLVGLCLDTGHWHYGGGDAVECVKEFGERIWHLHFKDCSPEIAAKARREGLDYFKAVEAGVFCELGQGDVDFPGVIAELEKNGFDGWANVEQDIVSDDPTAPKRFAQFNREYLNSIGL